MSWIRQALLQLFWISFSFAQLTQDSEHLLNWCLNGTNHKNKPGPESKLFSECAPWKNRSCCTYNTTKYLHEPLMYNFNYDHCSSVRKMSDGCRRKFHQDHCFYECSPNIGPWVVKVPNMKTRKERFYQVPLCRSDCESWYEACQDDYTCTDNWMRNFIWEKGRGNKCMQESECRTFKDVYRTATNFCQKVWDDAWKVVDDSEACMRIWFDGNGGNPNDNVAKYHVELMRLQLNTSATSRILSSSLVLMSLLQFLVARFCV